MTANQAIQITEKSYKILETITDFTAEQIEVPLRGLVDELGLTPGQVFGVLRVAVTGRTVSPPLFESMEIIGKEIVLNRIQNAIIILEDVVGSNT